MFINFCQQQKVCFLRTSVLSNQAKIFISRTLFFTNCARTFIWRAYSFVKMAKICEAYDDFCDEERYPTVILICQHLTIAFNNAFEIQTLECLAQETNVPCLWVTKIKLRIKGHHRYSHKYILGEKLECLRESENQHSEHVISIHSNKNNQVKKTAGHVPDTLLK